MQTAGLADLFNINLLPNNPSDKPYNDDEKTDLADVLPILDVLTKSKELVKMKISKLVEATQNHANNLKLLTQHPPENDFHHDEHDGNQYSVVGQNHG